MSEKIPRYSPEDMERKHFSGPPRWVAVIFVILLVIALVAVLFPVFAQTKE